MTAARRILFLVALSVAMKAMFDPDVNARLVAWEPLGNLPLIVRQVVLHVPYALLAALLATRAEAWTRLPQAAGWYLALAVLAAGLFVPGAIASSQPAIALLATRIVVLLLVALIVMVLTRLTPKPGFIYEGSSFPAVRAFFALTLLLALSIELAAAALEVAGARAALDKVPAAYLNLAAAAIVVAAFIVASGVRFRSLQPNSASGWMTLGILLWLLGQLVEPAIPLLRTYGLHKERVAAAFINDATAIKAALEIAAHVVLLAGCFALLSHLLPERDRIARQ